MSNDFPLPDSKDKLFENFNSDYRQNAMVASGIDKLWLYSEAYKTAASKLYEQFDGSAFYANMLVYPLVFLSRQFIELRLKELIAGLNYTFEHNYKFLNEHSLLSLWRTYRNLVIQIGNNSAPEKDILDNTEKLIREFDSIDPGSFSFRYPVDTKAERNPSLNMKNMDLGNFMSTMRKLYNFFDAQSEVIAVLIDYTDTLISKYESEVYSYYM